MHRYTPWLNRKVVEMAISGFGTMMMILAIITWISFWAINTFIIAVLSGMSLFMDDQSGVRIYLGFIVSLAICLLLYYLPFTQGLKIIRKGYEEVKSNRITFGVLLIGVPSLVLNIGGIVLLSNPDHWQYIPFVLLFICIFTLYGLIRFRSPIVKIMAVIMLKKSDA